jgi:hypothetical protein
MNAPIPIFKDCHSESALSAYRGHNLLRKKNVNLMLNGTVISYTHTYTHPE